MSTKMLLILGVAAVAAYFLFIRKTGASGNVGAPGAKGVAGAAAPSIGSQVGQVAWGIASKQLGNLFGSSSSPAGNPA